MSTVCSRILGIRIALSCVRLVGNVGPEVVLVIDSSVFLCHDGLSVVGVGFVTGGKLAGSCAKMIDVMKHLPARHD